MRFDEFMRAALYDPLHGYYRKPRDPFGVLGDFVTASQVQPLFGKTIAAEAHALEPDAPVFELGPGRREMASAFGAAYAGIEVGDPLPEDLSGFVFANEFFDALPVRAATKQAGRLRELTVCESPDGGREFAIGGELEPAARDYALRYWPYVEEGGRFEIGFEALKWIDLLANRMRRGHLLIVDYGYTTRETRRFPRGTLMSYRRQAASEDVLADPGQRDITAHVAFDAILDRATAAGFETVRKEKLARLVLRVAEREPKLVEAEQARKQLKILLFGMGEAFECLTLRRSKDAKQQ